MSILRGLMCLSRRIVRLCRMCVRLLVILAVHVGGVSMSFGSLVMVVGGFFV